MAAAPAASTVPGRHPAALQPAPPKELTFGEYFSGKLRKLGEQHAATVTATTGGGSVFRGVSVWLDGRLDPPEDVLKLLIVQGGGTIQHVLTATYTTHIIAANLPDSKIKEIRSHKIWRPVVRPAWVVDSARAGRLLPTQPYILDAFAPGAALPFGVVGGAALPPPRRPAGAAPAALAPLAAPRSPASAAAPAATTSPTALVHSVAAPLERRPPEPPPRTAAMPPGVPRSPPPLHQLSSGADPKFLRRYNAFSRLHYLGSARAERQAQVAAAILKHAATSAGPRVGSDTASRDAVAAGAADAAGAEHPPSEPLPWSRVIAHVDIDCFFAQVALLSRPDLRSHPVVVAHTSSAPPPPPPPPPQQQHELAAAAAAAAAAACDPSSVAIPARGDLRGNDGDDFDASDSSDATVPLDLDDDDDPGGQGAKGALSAPPAADARSIAGARPVSYAPGGAAPGSARAPATSGTGAKRGGGPGGGGGGGSYGGEISSANYAARGFGVRAGMGVTRARALCPGLIVLPYDFPRIEAISTAVYDEFLRLTLRVQAVSCDEAYLDLTGTPDPAAALVRLRASVFARCGVTVSAGLGPNLLLARLATARAKPDGLFVVPADAAAQQALLDALPAADLPGVGYRCAELLASHGIERVAQLRATPAQQLRAWLGTVLGDRLARFARGGDDRAVVVIRPRKSIGLDATWGVRFSDAAQVTAFLQQLVAELVKRMHEAGAEAGALAAASAAMAAADGAAAAPAPAPVPFRAQTLTLTVLRRKPDAPAPGKHMGHGICDSLSRSRRWLAGPVCSVEAFSAAALALFREVDRELGCPPHEVRGFSLRAGGLSHPLQVDEDGGEEDGEGGGGGAGSSAVLRTFLQRGSAAEAAAAAASSSAASSVNADQRPTSSRHGGAPVAATAAAAAAPAPAVLRGPMRPGARRLQTGLAFATAPAPAAAAPGVASKRPRPVASDALGPRRVAASAAAISLLTQDEPYSPPPPPAPPPPPLLPRRPPSAAAGAAASSAAASSAVVNLADSASPASPVAGGDSDVEDVTKSATASAAAASRAAGSGRVPHPASHVLPRSRGGGGGASGAGAARSSWHPHTLRQATLLADGAAPAAAEERSRAALRDREAVAATLRAAGFDAAFFWALPEEEQVAVLRQAQSKRSRTATGIGAGAGGAAAVVVAAPAKNPAHSLPPQSRPSAAAATAAAGASPPRGGHPAAAAAAAGPVVLLLDDSQDPPLAAAAAAAAGAGRLETPEQQRPPQALHPDEAQLYVDAGLLPAVSAAGGWAAGLRAWMERIGPYPAPRDARALADRAVECITTHGAEHAVALLRCLRRHCAAIEAERARMAAVPGAEPEAEEAYRRGLAARIAAGEDVGTWADVEAAVYGAVDCAARESFGASVDWD